jgi:FKBP-type peptidyl-prolyl cis-trans isomerase
MAKRQAGDSVTDPESMMGKLLYTALLPAQLLPQAGTLHAVETLRTTPNGALYQDLKTGTGASAETGDVATIHLIGWLDDNGRQGKQIFNTRTQGSPVSFVIGTERVMQEWNEGVIGMRQGGKPLVRLPPSLAYGSRSVEDVIPANAGLIFIIELLDLEKHQVK